MLFFLILALSILGLLAGGAIAYVVGAASVLSFVAGGSSDFLAILPQRVFSQLDVFAFLAMPLFVLTGDLMNRGGVTRALIDLAMALVGRFKGGLGHVNIMASVFFAGVSGSAVADAAAMSNTLVPAMRERGYTETYAAAVTAASSIIGPIIPPSVILIFYGALMGASVPALFAAGVMPGLLLAAVLMAMNAWFARRDDHPGGAGIAVPRLGPALWHALPALSLPLIILGGVLFGFATPAESAAVAVLAAMGIGIARGELDWAGIVKAGERTAVMLGAVFVILCAIAAFSYLAALYQLPRRLGEEVAELGLGPVGYLIAINVVFLLAGMVMDVKAAVALLAPILVPVALEMGADPVHLGIVICFNITLGLLSPPFGGVLIIISTVTSVNYWSLVRAVAPFLTAQIALLLILTLFSEITLWLPRSLGLL
ncbi:TRAP transporter large permease [Ruegeria marina]|uniref:TRAP transporter large permease protein n=1 Tax=Ruegeria marina TaxID=639004 RepID=A0A1G7EUS7_9RHOB|nr:TRAP transporter large permease [Ruegeria marina]SDE67342.1 TRAP transporter, DctM subunit [Ruegeria marina]